jgi:hypothetical protein
MLPFNSISLDICANTVLNDMGYKAEVNWSGHAKKEKQFESRASV